MPGRIFTSCRSKGTKNAYLTLTPLASGVRRALPSGSLVRGGVPPSAVTYGPTGRRLALGGGLSL